MKVLSCFDEDDEELTGSPVFKREFLGAVFRGVNQNQGKGFLPRRTLILLDNAHRLDAPSWSSRTSRRSRLPDEVELASSSCSRSEVGRNCPRLGSG